MTCTNHNNVEEKNISNYMYNSSYKIKNHTLWTVDPDVQEKISEILMYGATKNTSDLYKMVKNYGGIFYGLGQYKSN